MPDDDQLQQIMERALPCRCTPLKLTTENPEATHPNCPRHAYGPAVLEALREAENKGAYQYGEAIGLVVLRHVRQGKASPLLLEELMDLPLPHPEHPQQQEQSDD